MGARVLVIEDNEENLRLTTFLLEAFGHTAIAARSGEEGVEAARRERPDLVLLDLQLPGMNGFDALRELRGQPGLGGVPVVALTALAMVGDREAGIRAGFDGYVTKPLAPERLAAELDAHLPADLRSRKPPAPAGGSGE